MLVEDVAAEPPRMFLASDIPASSDDDSPFQLCSFALPPKDGEIINRGILSECTSYRILRVVVDVSAYGEERAEHEARGCPSVFLGECVEKVHAGGREGFQLGFQLSWTEGVKYIFFGASMTDGHRAPGMRDGPSSNPSTAGIREKFIFDIGRGRVIEAR